MSKSFKSSSSSSLSGSSDPRSGCASVDCPKDEAVKSKSAIKKQLDEESEEECPLEDSSPEV